VVALELAEMTGEDGWPAWRVIAGDEARPHAARHARVFLFSIGQGPEPARADWQWVGAEAAAAALHEAGPDEALCCIWDTITATTTSRNDSPRCARAAIPRRSTWPVRWRHLPRRARRARSGRVSS